MLVRCSAPRLRAGEPLQVQGAILASATSPLLPPGLREGPPLPDPPSSCPKLLRTVRIAARVRVQGSGLLPSWGPTRLLWSPQTTPPFPLHTHTAHVGTPAGLGGREVCELRTYSTPRPCPVTRLESQGERWGHYIVLSTSSPSKHTDSSFTCPFSALLGAPSLNFQGCLWGKDWRGGETGKQPGEIWTQN